MSLASQVSNYLVSNYLAEVTSTGVLLRDVEDSDLGLFYEHQLEPGAFQMAAFSPRREREDHLAHWRKKILADDTVYAKTVVVGNDDVEEFVYELKL